MWPYRLELFCVKKEAAKSCKIRMCEREKINLSNWQHCQVRSALTRLSIFFALPFVSISARSAWRHGITSRSTRQKVRAKEWESAEICERTFADFIETARAGMLKEEVLFCLVNEIFVESRELTIICTDYDNDQQLGWQSQKSQVT